MLCAALTHRKICSRIKLLVMDRQQFKQKIALAEEEKARIRVQLGESDQHIVTLNASIEAAALLEAKLNEDFKAALARETAEAGAAKQAYEEENSKLRAHISAHPAPNEKCNTVSHFLILRLSQLTHIFHRSRLSGPYGFGLFRGQKCPNRL
jgi:hypothetical protein